jgi:hypothetical protein
MLLRRSSGPGDHKALEIRRRSGTPRWWRDAGDGLGGGRAGRDRVFGLAGLTLEQVRGPWILEKLAEWVMRRRMTTVP